jgi:membrane fusion protein (multidrug efflux system)
MRPWSRNRALSRARGDALDKRQAAAAMQSARARKGSSSRWRLLLAGVLLAAMVCLPALWRQGERAMQTGADEPKPLPTQSITPVVATEAKPPQKSVPVEVAEVAKGPLTEQVTAIGSLRSDEAVVMSSEIAGRIKEIHFEEGAHVEKGAPLITLDDSVYQAELHDAEAKQLLARQNNDRMIELFSRKITSGSSKDAAESSLAVSNAAIELAKAHIEKTRIVAPFAGIVGLRQVSIGEYITPGQALIGLDAIEQIKVDFKVPEKYLPTVHNGQAIEIKVDAFPGQVFKGQVFAIDPRVDIEGRSIFIRARVPNQEQKLRPGQFARVMLIHEVKPDALTVPEAAIVPKGEDQFVFKIVDGKAQLAKVSIGTRRAGRVELVDGVAAGELVVTAGQLKIRDGAAVTVVPAQEPKA